jgi:hypothetical protein
VKAVVAVTDDGLVLLDGIAAVNATGTFHDSWPFVTPDPHRDVASLASRWPDGPNLWTVRPRRIEVLDRCVHLTRSG